MMLSTAERLPPLQGGCNFRDLGGYATADGHTTRWRRLFRSGEMSRLTDADFLHLDTIGIRAICDLRSGAERRRSPTAWQRLTGLRYWSRPYEQSLGDLYRVMKSPTTTVDEAIEVMSEVYRVLPFEQAQAYSELFRMLAAGEVPLIFNCSAGKDRTGIAAALVLIALGVPHATVLADYELSSVTFDYRSSARRADLSGVTIPPEVAAALGGARQAYLAAAWKAIESAHGSIEDYLRDALGVTDAMLAQIRQHLLE